jgi:hypothetical protein
MVEEREEAGRSSKTGTVIRGPKVLVPSPQTQVSKPTVLFVRTVASDGSRAKYQHSVVDYDRRKRANE